MTIRAGISPDSLGSAYFERWPSICTSQSGQFMDNQDFMIHVMTVAVAVSAAAAIAIAVAAIGIVRVVRSLRDQAGAVLPQVRTLISTVTGIAGANQGNLKEITAHAAEILDSLLRVAGKTEHFAGEVAMRAKAQIERLEMLGGDAAGRIQHTVKQVNRAVRPILAIAAMAGELGFGAKHGVASFFRRLVNRRPPCEALPMTTGRQAAT